MVRLTLSFGGPLCGPILFFRFFTCSVFDGVPRRGRWWARPHCDLKPLSKDTRTFHNLGELMLTTALRRSCNCKLCTPSSVTQSPPLLLVASTTCSTRLKPFSSSPIVFTPVDHDIAPDSPDGCTGHGPVVVPGSPAARKRKPHRLREEPQWELPS